MTEISRRKFIQLSVIGSAVAATGCRPLTRYNPGLYRAEVTGTYGGYDNRVYPYVNQPDGLMDGVPQYFATVCQMCPAGCGLLVRTIGGRALKIEGNPAHPVSQGASCARGQAALQHLYNPDRLRQPHLHAKRGGTVTYDRPKLANPPDGRDKFTDVDAATTDWETALGKVTTGLTNAKGKVAILADAQEYGSSPTQMRLLNEFAAKVGGTVFSYSLLDDAPWRAAAKAVYGKNQVPAYQLDQADLIVSLGGDFLDAWPSPVYYGRLFGDFRQGPRRKQGEHGKFIYVGPRMSMTAAKADQWIPCTPGSEAAVAVALSQAVQAYAEGDLIPSATHEAFGLAEHFSGIPYAQIEALARELSKAGPRAVAVAGNGLMSSANPTESFTAVERINLAVKSQCIGFGAAAIAAPAMGAQKSGLRGIQNLTQAMNSGQVGALIVLGQPNPVFTLPSAVGFSAALAKVPFIAALTTFEDETTAYADVVLPTRSFLEEWGDHVPPVIPPGVKMATLRQPIIDPQFVGGHGQVQDNTGAFVPWWDTRPTGDLLADIAKRIGSPMTETDSRAAVRKTWAGIGQADLAADTTENDTKWVNALAQGGIWGANAAIPVSTPALPNLGNAPGLAPDAKPGQFTLQLYPHIYFTDGRHANLGWLQENPDPMTMAVWNSWVEINMQVAHELDIRTGDLVQLTSAHGSVQALAVPYPAIHPSALAMPIGQGHSVYGRNAAGRGYSALSIVAPTADPETGALAYGTTTVTLTKVASAKSGYFPDNTTLVLAQDRPGGVEPEEVKNLIHTTAKEWKTAKKVTGPPAENSSLFNRGKSGETPQAPGATGEPGPAAN